MSKTLKSDNLFEEIKLANKEIAEGLFRPIVPIEGEKNPKQRLLHDISVAIAKSEKANLMNHTVVKAKIIKKEVLVGDKVSKLLKTKKHKAYTKTNVRNQFDVALYGRKQTTILLKKIKKRIKEDKSDPLDFDALNADIKALRDHYQDKVILHDAHLENKAAAKSLQKLERGQKKAESGAQKVQTEKKSNKDYEEFLKQQEDKNNLLNSSAADIKKYNDKILEWQQKNPKPRSMLDKALDFATEPLMPSLNSYQNQGNSEANNKKPPALSAHSVADKMRSGFSPSTNDQRQSDSFIPEVQAQGRKDTKGKGR